MRPPRRTPLSPRPVAIIRDHPRPKGDSMRSPPSYSFTKRSTSNPSPWTDPPPRPARSCQSDCLRHHSGLTMTLLSALSLASGLWILSAAADLPAATAARGERRPNVLVILADDLGYSDLGCYGGEVPTPNIDRLAAGGARFSAFYNSARCCPSRASLMTGLHPHEAGIGSFAQPKPSHGLRARLHRPPAARHRHPRRDPRRRRLLDLDGRQVAHGHPRPDQARLPKLLRLQEFPRPLRKPVGPREVRPPARGHRSPSSAIRTDNFYVTDVFTDYALEFLRRPAPNHPTESKPWFLYLAHSSPHFPIQAPKESIDKHVGTYRRGWDRAAGGALRTAEETRPGPGRRPPSPALRGAGRSRRHRQRLLRQTQSRLGLAPCRPPRGSRPPRRHLRRDGRARRPGHRPHPRRPRGTRRSRQHPDLLHQRQRRLLRVGALRLRRPSRTRHHHPSQGRRARRHGPGRHPLTPTAPAGPTSATRRSTCTSTSATRAASAPRSIVHWPAGIEARPGLHR